jgi:hypothetical protein
MYNYFMTNRVWSRLFGLLAPAPSLCSPVETGKKALAPALPRNEPKELS